MKVISLLQPWASLVVLGHKKIETRRWDTKFRGPLLIHASAKWTKEHENLAHHFFQMTQDSRVYHCERGAIIGQVDLEGTAQFTPHNTPGEVWRCMYKEWHLTEQEVGFGDYTPGRYGWLLSNPQLFLKPIPAKGSLGLWNFDMQTVAV